MSKPVFRDSKWGRHTVLDLGEPVTQLFMWTKYKPNKWQFWAKQELWLCIGVGKKLYKMDPNTEQITEWKLPEMQPVDYNYKKYELPHKGFKTK